MKIITMVVVIAAICVISVRGQGFLNLNFESAQNLPGNPGNRGMSIFVTNALPDWIAYDGDLALVDIYYVSNSFPGVSTAVELEGGSLALNGNNLSVGLYENSAISQTAVVPDNAESLQFEAEGPGPDGLIEGGANFSVTLGGQSLPYSVLSDGPGYDIYGANIPADLDGQTEALIFGCQGIGSGNVLLDDIEFSPETIPEPGEFGLMGLGLVLLGVFTTKTPSHKGTERRM